MSEAWYIYSIANCKHTAEILGQIIYIDYLMTTCEMKKQQVRAYIQQLFHNELKGTKFI